MDATTAIRPFLFHAAQDDLDDWKRRILATRFPEKKTVSYNSQGVPISTIKALKKGGHFPAWEQREIFTVDLRAAFKSLRK
jgi:hypothetical protein